MSASGQQRGNFERHGVPAEGGTIFGRKAKPDYVIGDNGCWVWQKFLLRGYAHMGGHGRIHRVYYRLAYGDDAIPEGWDLHHRCENTACINPEHLEPIDRFKHRGDHIRARKRVLTWDQVREIRARAQADHTLSYPTLAGEYSVSVGHIQDIVENVGFHDPDYEWRKPERNCLFCGAAIGFDRPRHATYCSPEHRKAAAWRRSNAKRKAR